MFCGLKLLATAFRPDQFPKPLGEEVILAGRSNVGKSSLINLLAGIPQKNVVKEGARVSSKPGCTRSVNFFQLWPGVVLVDLPGFGYAKLPLNVRHECATLIKDYLASRPHIGMILHLADIRHPLQPLDWQMLEWGRHFQHPYLLCFNKCDKLSRSQLAQRRREMELVFETKPWKPEMVTLSAMTGQGLPELKKRLRDLVRQDH
jgi:GTP-binding protein